MTSTSTTPALVPFITSRAGEDPSRNNLVFTSVRGYERLSYEDEGPFDRDAHGVLWGRCALNPCDDRGVPTGEPLWKLMHPFRQRMAMTAMRCQVCAEPARTPLGYVFLAATASVDLDADPALTSQPPVCGRCVRAALKLCPHLQTGPIAFIAQGAPLYGVHGVLYGRRRNGAEVTVYPDHPLPYGHPELPVMLASQLVRRLSRFRIVDAAALLDELAAA